MCQSRDVSRSFVSNSGLACAECGLHQAVLREYREERLKRSPSNLVVDFSSSLLLQDRVAVHSEDVVDAADPETFTKENNFCLRVLT